MMSHRFFPLLVATAIVAAGCATTPHPQAVAAGGGTVFVDDGGRGGVPVVFLHGNGGTSAVWRAQLEHLRRDRRALALDLPGFGKSTPPPNGDYSLGAMASAIDAATRALGVRRFVLVAHSYAGAVAATFAAAHPDRVAGVVYVDSAATKLALTPEQKEKITAALRADKMSVVKMFFAPMLKPSSDDVRAEVLRSAEETPTGAFTAALMSLAEYDAGETVRAYAGPKLAIIAADLENPLSFQEQFPEIENVSISGAGHWLMLDKPAEVNAALDRFLK